MTDAFDEDAEHDDGYRIELYSDGDAKHDLSRGYLISEDCGVCGDAIGLVLFGSGEYIGGGHIDTSPEDGRVYWVCDDCYNPEMGY